MAPAFFTKAPNTGFFIGVYNIRLDPRLLALFPDRFGEASLWMLRS
jgi:hypothetical protein